MGGDAERRAKAEGIFGRALQIPSAGQRRAYLHEACGGDERLRAEVEELLRRQDEAGSLPERPAVEQLGQTATQPWEPVAEGPGTVIAGRYKLLQQIGEGGMGIVYMADRWRTTPRWPSGQRGWGLP